MARSNEKRYLKAHITELHNKIILQWFSVANKDQDPGHMDTTAYHLGTPLVKH